MNGSQSGVSGTMKLRVALSTDVEDVEQPEQPYVPGGLGAADASPDDASVMTRIDSGRRITRIEREGETVTITDSPSRIVVHRLDRTVEPPASRYVAVTTPRALQAKDPAAHALYERYVVRRAAAALFPAPARARRSSPKTGRKIAPPSHVASVGRVGAVVNSSGVFRWRCPPATSACLIPPARSPP